MPRSGWLRELASKVAIPLLFLLIGGLVVGYFIRLGLQEEWASRRDAQTRSEQYAETKQNPEYNGCARLPPIHQDKFLAIFGTLQKTSPLPCYCTRQQPSTRKIQPAPYRQRLFGFTNL